MWIEHDGKGAPDLPPGTQVYVRFRDGQEGRSPDPWEYWTFSRKHPRFDIVAYRVAT